MYALGRNYDGSLGVGTFNYYVSYPMPIAVGWLHSCDVIIFDVCTLGPLKVFHLSGGDECVS